MNKTGYILVVQPGCCCLVLFQHLNHCLDFGTCIGPCRTLRTLFFVLVMGDSISTYLKIASNINSGPHLDNNWKISFTHTFSHSHVFKQNVLKCGRPTKLNIKLILQHRDVGVELRLIIWTFSCFLFLDGELMNNPHPRKREGSKK